MTKRWTHFDNDHPIYEANRLSGRFALDGSEGPTMEDGHPLRILHDDGTGTDGKLELAGKTTYFVPDDGSERFELQEGMRAYNPYDDFEAL